MDAASQCADVMARTPSVFFTDFAAFKAAHDACVEAQSSFDDSLVADAVALIRFCEEQVDHIRSIAGLPFSAFTKVVFFCVKTVVGGLPHKLVDQAGDLYKLCGGGVANSEAFDAGRYLEDPSYYSVRGGNSAAASARTTSQPPPPAATESQRDADGKNCPNCRVAFLSEASMRWHFNSAACRNAGTIAFSDEITRFEEVAKAWRETLVAWPRASTADDATVKPLPKRVADEDTKFRLLESLMHSNDEGRLIDSRELAVALLLVGVTRAKQGEGQAHVRRALEVPCGRQPFRSTPW